MEVALDLAKKYKIDLNKLPLKEWMYALVVETEHSALKDFNLDMAAQIAIAHLMEYPDYYKRLKKMEKEAEKYWSTREKKSVFKWGK